MYYRYVPVERDLSLTAGSLVPSSKHEWTIGWPLSGCWGLNLLSFRFQFITFDQILMVVLFLLWLKKLWLLFWNIAWINRIHKENGSKPHKVLHYAVKQHLYFPLDLCHYIKYNERYQPTFKYNKVKITAVSVFRNLLISNGLFFTSEPVKQFLTKANTCLSKRGTDQLYPHTANPKLPHKTSWFCRTFKRNLKHSCFCWTPG